MTLAGFWLAKARGDEAALGAMGAAEASLLAELEGRSVALVGNARGLAQGRHGAEIDAADIVVRMNAAPIPDPLSHGMRTDWLGTSVGIPRSLVADRAPRRLIWVTPRRKRLPYWMARDARFFLYPATRANALARTLGTRPTTGLMLVDLVMASAARSVTLWGFDFFASQSLSGGRSASEVPHDFSAEAAHVASLAARDPRVRMGSPKPH
jgi:hypothetical protein